MNLMQMSSQSKTDSEQIWKDAMLLLQYAFRAETNPDFLLENPHVPSFLSEVRCSIEKLQRNLRRDSNNAVEAMMVNRLTQIYRRVVKGELTDENEYRTAILRDGGFLHEDEKKNIPQEVLGILVKDREAIIEDRGPVEAAALSAAEYFNRGARRLMEYRAQLARGELKTSVLVSLGVFLPNYDLLAATLTKIFGLEIGLAREVVEILKPMHKIKPLFSTNSNADAEG